MTDPEHPPADPAQPHAGGRTEPSADDDTHTGGEPGSEQHSDEGEPGSGEAARYRRRLRDTEAERDQLRERVEGMQRREAERLASTGEARLHDASDLWTYGETVDALLGDDGQVDPERVQAAVERISDGRDYLRADRRTPRPDPSQGARESGAPAGQRLGAIFSQR